MNHPVVVDVFAFQEALLLEAVFALAILTMIWVGFRRWLQHKEKMGRLIADETAERDARYGAAMERVEARLKAIEEIVTDRGAGTPPQLDQVHTPPLPEPSLKRDEA